jgi:2-methylcitrate dehydratase PrpD
MTYTSLLAERYHQLTFNKLSKKSIESAKQVLIDYLACTYAGLSDESSKIVREYSQESYARGKCTLIGVRKKLTPPGAAFVNGATGHAVELDECSNEGGGHPGVTIIPAALAMGEYSDRSGRDVLRSIILGYDAFIRIGKAANYDSCFSRGFHPTPLFGMFGATMTASQLLKLNVEETTNALGIVGSYVAGNLEFLSGGSLTKRIQPGIASSSGVTAAMLACRGFTGPKSILEGARGFYHAYCDGARPDDLKRESNPLEIESISFKPHACCRFNQAGIDAVLEILTKNNIPYTSIKSILVELPARAYNVVGQPNEVKFNPKTAAEGQFSSPYSVAVACIERKALLDEYTDQSVVRPDVNKFMKKITIKHAPNLDQYFPESFATQITVNTEDGSTFVKEVRYPKGAKKGKQIVDMTMQLEKVQNVADFTKLL